MLRASLRSTARQSRVLRQFSSTPLTWNASTGDPKPNDNSSKSADTESDSVGASSSDSSLPSSKDSSSARNTEPEKYDLATLKKNLAKLSNEAAIKFRQRADDFTASTKITFTQLGAQLNKVTGYEEIEALKQQVVEQGV